MFSTSRVSLLAIAAALLLLAGCGTHASLSDVSSGPGAVSSSPGAGHHGQSALSTAAPRPEGTGPESPLPRTKGGVSLSVAALPIGGSSVGTEFTNNDQYACVVVSWLGTLRAPVTVTVTGVVVVQGPFEPVDVATAGCSADAPPCAGLTITAASDSGTQCIAAVRSTGRAPSGSVELAGSLSCHRLGPAACQQVANKVKSDVLANGPVQFDFPVPPVTDTTSPPATDTTSPPATDTTSPATDTTSPPASDTTSPAPTDASSP